MLGWLRTSGLDGVKRDFYVRQLWDGKGSAIVELMDAERDDHLREALRRPSPGRTRARATRSRSRPTSAAATPSTTRWPQFAEAYADQNERDYEALTAAVKAGEIKAETGL